MDLGRFESDDYAAYGSSPEVLAAIEALTGQTLPQNLEADITNVAYRYWADPAPHEEAEVEREAWDLADAAKQELNWGQRTLHRDPIRIITEVMGG